MEFGEKFLVPLAFAVMEKALENQRQRLPTSECGMKASRPWKYTNPNLNCRESSFLIHIEFTLGAYLAGGECAIVQLLHFQGDWPYERFEIVDFRIVFDGYGFRKGTTSHQRIHGCESIHTC
jgi:hypothetical protein